MTEASLRSYFNFCKAYIGLCKATQFKWEEPEYNVIGGLVPGEKEEDEPQVNKQARLKMITKTKNTSAYMFNYEILRDLMDVDFERVDGGDEPDLPF